MSRPDAECLSRSSSRLMFVSYHQHLSVCLSVIGCDQAANMLAVTPIPYFLFSPCLGVLMSSAVLNYLKEL